MSDAMRRVGLAVAVLVLMAGAAGRARADLLIAVQVGSTDPFGPTATALDFQFGAGTITVKGGPEVILDVVLHNSDVGSTLDLTSSDPADFTALAGFLTNGVNDGLGVRAVQSGAKQEEGEPIHAVGGRLLLRRRHGGQGDRSERQRADQDRTGGRSPHAHPGGRRERECHHGRRFRRDAQVLWQSHRRARALEPALRRPRRPGGPRLFLAPAQGAGRLTIGFRWT
jgi:hypothetical protein